MKNLATGHTRTKLIFSANRFIFVVQYLLDKSNFSSIVDRTQIFHLIVYRTQISCSLSFTIFVYVIILILCFFRITFTNLSGGVSFGSSVKSPTQPTLNNGYWQDKKSQVGFVFRSHFSILHIRIFIAEIYSYVSANEQLCRIRKKTWFCV